MAARFEESAREALSVPALAERSVALRSAARQVLEWMPPSARPYVRRAGLLGDRLLRAAYRELQKVLRP